MKAEHLILSLTIALLLGLGVAPLLAMITASVTVDGGFSLAHYPRRFSPLSVPGGSSGEASSSRH
jgi:Na+/glutamate symporter